MGRMDNRALLDIVEIASTDVRAIDSQVIGIAVMVLYADGDGVAVQLGADTPPRLVRMAIVNLAQGMERDGSDFQLMPNRKLRKAV
jgi:hypothetical protein